MALILKDPNDYMQDLAARLKAARLVQNLSQLGLAKRSGVSLASLKRFETTGQISLESLLRLALVLGALQDFDNLFVVAQRPRVTLDEIIAESTTRKRGRVQ